MLFTPSGLLFAFVVMMPPFVVAIIDYLLDFKYSNRIALLAVLFVHVRHFVF